MFCGAAREFSYFSKVFYFVRKLCVIGSGRLLTYIATDVSSVYFDGREQQVFGMESGDWKNGYTIQVPSDLQVIGIKSNATPSTWSGNFGIIAWTNDDYILTNSSWKCTNQVPGTSWTDVCYDDTNWQTASEVIIPSCWCQPSCELDMDRLVC